MEELFNQPGGNEGGSPGIQNQNTNNNPIFDQPIITDEPYQQQNNANNADGGYFDEGFGGQQAGYEAPNNNNFFGGSTGNEFSRPQTTLTFGNPIKTQEEIEEDERMRAFNEKKAAEIEEKELYERDQKNERKTKSRQILNEWIGQWSDASDKRKNLNKERQIEEQKIKKAHEFKNPWDKVINNVAIKEADYQGIKDVSRFRQALLNRKLDESTNPTTNGPSEKATEINFD